MSATGIRHPDGAYPVVDSVSELPPSRGGIEVVATVTRRAARHTLAPQIGVDGAPALYGWGRSIIVVEPGRHVVEVQYLEPMDSAMVSVLAGEVTRLHYRVAADRPGELRPAGDPSPAPTDRRWSFGPIVGWALLKAVVVIALAVGIVAAIGALGAPSALGLAIVYPLALVATVWIFISAARARERGLARAARPPRRHAGRASGDRPRPLARRDPVPAAPAGQGAVLVALHFTSDTDIVERGQVLDDRPNYETWTLPPQVLLDGRIMPAGWGTWWYPLPPGEHDVEVTEPAAARHRIEVTAGSVVALDYRTTIRIRRDVSGAQVGEPVTTASLAPRTDRPLSN